MSLFGGQSRPVVEEPEPEELPELPAPRSSTVIAPGITISGDVCGSGVVEIEGTVEGQIQLDGAVTVALTGVIKGPVQASVVNIAGRVEGSAEAREHLRLEKTGIIEGDVTSRSFVIEDGGRLNGRCTMTGSGN